MMIAGLLVLNAQVFAADAPAPVSTTGTSSQAQSSDGSPVVDKITPALAPADLPAVSTSDNAVNPAALVPPSQNVTINLINRLVQRGILSKEDATDLIKQAEADADIAHAQAVATQAASAQAAAAQAAVAQAVSGSLTPPSDDSTRVTYIPEVVKQQMRDQIKQEVMDQARDENWAAPRTLPEWTTRIKLFGDIRARYEGDFYPAGNFTGLGSDYWNFNAINTSSTPYDYTSPTTNPPYYNNNANRNRFRLRARLGARFCSKWKNLVLAIMGDLFVQSEQNLF